MAKAKRTNPAALPNYYWQSFLDLGAQYYVAARLQFFTQGGAVVGVLAHHAVEMFLKGALCIVVPITDLESEFSHSLPKLWTRFKTEKGVSGLVQCDSTIELLHEFEDIRYPDKVLHFAVLTSLEPVEFPPVPYLTHTFRFILRDLDALVHCILTNASVDPLKLRLGPKGRAALARDNATGIWTTSRGSEEAH
jgi:hypothetical protein